MAQYEGSDLMARLKGLEPLQSLAGDHHGQMIANFARDNGLEQAAPAAPSGPTAPSMDQSNEQGGWNQILGVSAPSGPNSMGGM